MNGNERPENVQRISEKDGYELEDEVNKRAGYVEELLKVILWASWAEHIKGLPEYMVLEGIDKMEEMKEIQEEMIKRIKRA